MRGQKNQLRQCPTVGIIFFVSKPVPIKRFAVYGKPEIEIQTKLSQMLPKRASEGLRWVEETSLLPFVNSGNSSHPVASQSHERRQLTIVPTALLGDDLINSAFYNTASFGLLSCYCKITISSILSNHLFAVRK